MGGDGDRQVFKTRVLSPNKWPKNTAFFVVIDYTSFCFSSSIIPIANRLCDITACILFAVTTRQFMTFQYMETLTRLITMVWILTIQIIHSSQDAKSIQEMMPYAQKHTPVPSIILLQPTAGLEQSLQRSNLAAIVGIHSKVWCLTTSRLWNLIEGWDYKYEMEVHGSVSHSSVINFYFMTILGCFLIT